MLLSINQVINQKLKIMKVTFKNAALSLLFAGLISGCSKSSLKEGSSGQESGSSEKVKQTQAYSQQCDNGKTITVGASYKLNNNIWGASSDGAGSQCVWYDSTAGTWGVNASHTSGSDQDIKGYPALVRGWVWYNSSGVIWASASDTTFPVQLSQVQTFTSGWNVTVPANGEKYNTSYDIWLDTQSNPNYKPQYEIMVWINYKGPAYGGTDFKPIGTKVESNVTVAGNTWDIYTGQNSTNNVYTFRRTTNTSTVSNLDLKALITYAKNAGFIQNSYYLLGVQAGWEIVAGGTFTTNSYWTALTKL
jgi:hypothetical protein